LPVRAHGLGGCTGSGLADWRSIDRRFIDWRFLD
jgi:hypothetical protein